MSILFGKEWRDKKMHIEYGGQYIMDFGVAEKNYDPEKIKDRAKIFSKEIFVENIMKVIEEKMEE